MTLQSRVILAAEDRPRKLAIRTGVGRRLRPTDHASGASGVHPTPEAPASAAPASPMCHIAPWMRLPLAGGAGRGRAAPPRPALLRASSALRRALSGHC